MKSTVSFAVIASGKVILNVFSSESYIVNNKENEVDWTYAIKFD